MTGRNLWAIIGVVALLGIALLWFLMTFEQREKVHWIGLQGDAKTDNYYVAERFLQAKGIKVTRETTYTRLNQSSDFNGYDTVFFSNKGKTLTQPQINTLLIWVEQGGQLVINSRENYLLNQNNDTDKLTAINDIDFLKTAGIAVSDCRLDTEGKRSCPDHCQSMADQEETEKTEARDNEQRKPLNQTQRLDNRLDKRLDKRLAITSSQKPKGYSTFNVDGKIIQRRWSHYKQTLFAYQGRATPQWIQPAYCRGDLFAVFNYGKGNIVVYQEPQQTFTNSGYEYSDNILSDHNATYLYYLLNAAQTAKNILWFERDTYRNAWEIVWDYGFYALLTAVLLVLAWAWKNGRRFGPLIAVDERETLSLKRHLRAMGDFYLKHDKRNVLIANCYEQLDQAIAKAIPIAATLTKNELAESINEKTEVPLVQIHRVLARRYPEDDAAFSQLIQTINEIRKRL